MDAQPPATRFELPRAHLAAGPGLDAVRPVCPVPGAAARTVTYLATGKEACGCGRRLLASLRVLLFQDPGLGAYFHLGDVVIPRV